MASILEALEQYRVKKAPRVAFYVPEFITEDEEKSILKNVYSAPKPKWKQLNNRRLQNWGGLPHPKGMVLESLPPWLDIYASKLADLKVFEDKRPNHVLVNEYLPKQGIMPHSDGPLFYPTISTLNLGCHTLLNFYQPSSPDPGGNENSVALEDRYLASLLLMPRSLLVLKEDLYEHYHHGIDEAATDIVTDKVLNLDAISSVKIGDELRRQSARVSLTIRHVPKTLKFKWGR